MDAGPIKLIFAVDAIVQPLTGIGRYAFELACRLPNLPQIQKVRFFDGFRLVPMPSASAPRAQASRLLRAWALRTSWVAEAYRHLVPVLRWVRLRLFRDHVFHSPNYFLPPFPGPCVVTFHDLSHVRYPNCHPLGRVRFMEKEVPLSLRRANHILAVSEFTRQELVEYYGLSPERITAVPLAAGPEFCLRGADEVRPVLARYGLTPGAYALFVGTIEPRKNLARLLEAFAGSPLALRRRYPLILVGERGWCSADLHRRIAQAQSQGWARYLDYVPQAVLPHLYAGARVFVYPSLYEGFGLPVLEAMACGVPVVCSNAASLPEVTGGAALLHHPEDIDGLRRLLEQALEDESWRSEGIRSGLARAQEFSWERTVARTAEVYVKAARDL